MQRLRMASAAFSIVAVVSVGALGAWPGSSHAGLMDRPRDPLCPPEEYLCPAHYAPRVALMYHDVDTRFAHEPLSAPPVNVEIESPFALPLDVIPGPAVPRPVADVPSLPVADEYRPADCGCDDEHTASLAELAADPRHSTGLTAATRLNAESEGLHEADVPGSLAEVIADPNHSSGQEEALRINGENEGLDVVAADEAYEPYHGYEDVYENVPAYHGPRFHEGMYEYDAWDGDGREPADMDRGGDEYGEDLDPAAWDTVLLPPAEGEPSRIMAMALKVRNAVRDSLAQVSRTIGGLLAKEDETFEPAAALTDERCYVPAFGSPWESGLRP